MTATMKGLTAEKTILEIEDLRVEYQTPRGPVKAIRGLSLTVKEGESVGIIGESGCGKSSLGYSIIQSIPFPGHQTGGSIRFDGQNLSGLGGESIRHLRGRRMSMILQDPMTSLNPTMTVSNHFSEMIKTHNPSLSVEERLDLTVELLEKLGIKQERIGEYPHQFSGGMRQRVMIGLALCLRPALVIADEPTSSLDALVEAQILQLLNKLKEELNLTLILISHNIGIVAEYCDRVVIMYAGQIVEDSPTDRIFEKPLHPYTQALLASIPNIKSENQKLKWIPGAPPDLLTPPATCSYAARCPYVFEQCRVEEPQLSSQADGTKVRCFLYR